MPWYAWVLGPMEFLVAYCLTNPRTREYLKGWLEDLFWMLSS